jgi:hypothetical protein
MMELLQIPALRTEITAAIARLTTELGGKP